MKKLVIIINGKGGVGKDTLCNALNSDFKVRNVSSITPIKEIASRYGWKGEKNDQSRLFLSRLKLAFTEYNDLPNKFLMEQYQSFLDSEEELLCVHIREADQIKRFVNGVKLPYISILVKRDMIKKSFGNASDDLVENYNYDIVFNNNSSLDESMRKFNKLIKMIYDEQVNNKLEDPSTSFIFQTQPPNI